MYIYIALVGIGAFAVITVLAASYIMFSTRRIKTVNNTPLHANVIDVISASGWPPHEVIINKGRNDGVSVGEFFAVYCVHSIKSGSAEIGKRAVLKSWWQVIRACSTFSVLDRSYADDNRNLWERETKRFCAGGGDTWLNTEDFASRETSHMQFALLEGVERG